MMRARFAATMVRRLTLGLCALAGSSMAQTSPSVRLLSGGAEPAFDTVGRAQGLQSSTTLDLMVDRDGFLWVGGNNGLHRFDGRSVFSLDRRPGDSDSLLSRRINALAETTHGIWIAHPGGVLQRLDRELGRLVDVPLIDPRTGRPAVTIRSLAADARNRLWLRGDFGLLRFDPDSGRVEPVPGAERLAGFRLDLSPDRSTLYLLSDDFSVLAIDIDSPEVARVVFTLPAASRAPVSSMLADAQGLWLVSGGRLWHYDLARAALEHVELPVDLLRATSMVRGPDGTLWMGSVLDDGLVRFQPQTGELSMYRHHVDDPYSLPSNRVSDLVVDPHNNLWIGLLRDGVARLRLHQQGVARYRLEGARGASVCAMQPQDGQHLLLSFCGAGLGRLDLETGRVEDLGAQLALAAGRDMPTLTAHRLIADGDGGLWIPSTSEGLLHWDPKQAQLRRFPIRGDPAASMSPYMSDAMFDAQGRLWVAHRTGLSRLDPGGTELLRVGAQGEQGRIEFANASTLSPGPDGSIWVGTMAGLFMYEPESGRARSYLHDPHNPGSLPDDLVLALHQDGEGRLWVGTQAGLARLIDDGQGRGPFRRYDRSDGLPDITIDAIVEDAQGQLWLGTDRGLARWIPDQDRFHAYLPVDGIPDSNINKTSALLGRDGSLYFGSFSGLIRIDPTRLRGTPPAPLMLSSHQLGDRRVLNLMGHRLPSLSTRHDEASVGFRIAVQGDVRRLAYRMLGSDPRWQDMPEDPVIRFFNLPPNDYVFEVRQLDQQGRWEEPAIRIPVHVAPPFWRSSAAMFVYAGAALVALLWAWIAGMQRRRRRRAYVHELRRLATVDALTGLPNRGRFGTVLAQRLAADPEARLALLFVDLDRFKNVNDSLGHQFGDEVLKAAAARFSAALPGDTLLARLGGDEFTVLVEGGIEEAEAVARALLQACLSPLQVAGSEVVLSASIGIGLSPAHASDPDTLLQYADAAMYRAKEIGRNTFQVFDPQLVARVSRRMALESGLRRALERGELRPVLQPRIALLSGRISGAEILMRWHSAEFGEVSPAEFIPILEDSGVIHEVGQWLAEWAFEHAAELRRRGHGELVIGFNVSVHQLIRGRLIARINELVELHGEHRCGIEIEITESALMHNAALVGARLDLLRALGLGLAIDDFGTGYSSFAYLSRLPVDKLKIDRSFIDGVGSRSQASALCEAIIAMSHRLGLSVVAEGVETPLQLQALRGMGCDEVQGYLTGEPMTADAFEARLEAQPDLASVPGERGARPGGPDLRA